MRERREIREKKVRFKVSFFFWLEICVCEDEGNRVEVEVGFLTEYVVFILNGGFCVCLFRVVSG